jgi:hypothetical protein
MDTAKDDLKHIRTMMERSGTFVSLSGLSGVGAGMIALIGSALVFFLLDQHSIDYFDGKPNYYPGHVLRLLAIVAAGTFILALIISVGLTMRKSKKLGVPLWSTTTRQTLKAMLVPLLTGGIFCVILTINHLFYLVAPCMLIFYGLALVSTSKYTHQELFSLGICELVLGLLAAWFVGYGLLFWAIGFGVLHIIYGAIMHRRYDDRH